MFDFVRLWQSTTRSMGAEGSNTHEAVSDDSKTASGYVNTPEAIQALQFLQPPTLSNDGWTTAPGSRTIFRTRTGEGGNSDCGN